MKQSNITKHDNTTKHESKSLVLIQNGYPIINPETMSEAEFAWLCVTRKDPGRLPQRSVWLSPVGYTSQKDAPDKLEVLEVYFKTFDATPEEEAPFRHWLELRKEWLKAPTVELAREITYGNTNDLGLWPITPSVYARIIHDLTQEKT